MKRSLLLAAAAVTTAAPLQAADLPPAMPVKAPAAVVAASPWSGFYAGFGLGLRTTRTDVTTTSAGLAVANGPSNNIGLAGLATGDPLDGIAFRPASYAGFNWQFAPQWVIGVEGDVGSAERTRTLAGFPFSPAVLTTALVGDGLAVKTTWDASARVRLGFLLTPTTLVYATGGAAWQRYDVTSTCGSRSFCVVDRATPQVIASSVTKPGWTAGAGIETALWGNWLARAEYRYADFGTSSFFLMRSAVTGVPFSVSDNFDVALRTHTVTFGLAYKLGDPVGPNQAAGATAPYPVKALPIKAPPPGISWSGLYAGLGLGLRASHAEATTLAEPLIGFPTFQTESAPSEPLDGTAFRASPYAGYNWQVAPQWVIGVEGEVGLANQTTTLAGFPFSPAFGQSQAAGAAGDSLALKTTWDASIRGRLGFLLTPATLVYATGGAAWQHYDVISTCADIGFCARNAVSPAVITNSTTKAGWTIGGGIETALWSNWLVRADYRYADFGTSTFNLARTTTGAFLPNPVTDTFTVALRTHTVTFGLAYKFDWATAPVVAKF